MQRAVTEWASDKARQWSDLGPIKMYSKCSEVLTDEIPKNTPKHREEVQMWFKHKKIQGFYDVLQVSPV